MGYAKYGMKQDNIEGALEELDDMIKHYNTIAFCVMHKGDQETRLSEKSPMGDTLHTDTEEPAEYSARGATNDGSLSIRPNVDLI